MPMPQQVGLTPEQIAQFQANPNEWMRNVLGGGFLGSNPYLDELIRTTEADAMRQYGEAILPTATSALNMSGAYGTALGKQAQANTARDFAQGLMGQTAGLRFQDYGAERDRMMEAMRLLSGETAASRQGLFGARDTDVGSATNIETANIGRSGQLGAARIGAGAARYGADRGYAAAQLGAQSDYWRNLFNQSQQQNAWQGGPPNTGQQQPPSAPTWGVPRPMDPWGGEGGGWGSPGAW